MGGASGKKTEKTKRSRTTEKTKRSEKSRKSERSEKSRKSENSSGTAKQKKSTKQPRKVASSSSTGRTSSCWEVRPSPVHGRGVFATRRIEADEVVHVAPVLLFSDEEYDHLAQTLLVDYVFEWHQGGVALALGVGGLFNHDANANLRYELCDDDDPARPGHSYVAERRIKKGEELTINYGDEYAEWHGWI